MEYYYVEFNVKTGYYIEAESEEEAITKAYPYFEEYEPDIKVDLAPEEIKDEFFYYWCGKNNNYFHIPENY